MLVVVVSKVEGSELELRKLEEYKVCEGPIEALFGVLDYCGVGVFEMVFLGPYWSHDRYHCCLLTWSFGL